MKSKRIFWVTLLAAFLACGMLASCGGDDHQTPPALSGDGGDDDGGDGGDGGDDGQDEDGYPAGLTVETFTDELSGGAQCLGFYAVVDFKTNPKLLFRPKFSGAKTPTTYFSDFAESGDGTPYVVVNGGYFGGTTSVSLLVEEGEMKSMAAQSDVCNGQTYYPVRAAFGQMADGSFETAWVYCLRAADNRFYPYAYPSPLDNDERTETFMPEPPTASTEGAHIWEVEYAIGAGPMLVYDGKNVAEENYWKEVFEHGGVSGMSRHPRTSIGATADGKLIVLVCDGRGKRGSAGFTLPELADKMISLGCIRAINLDGGGSSTFVGKDGAVLNMPSDTQGTTLEGATIVQRRIPTAVVIAEAK